jgi:hypothetical protein
MSRPVRRFADTTPGWIELSNVRIVPPTPVGVGNLSLFIGLYSVPGSDIVSTLLDVVGDLSKTAGAVVPMAAISPALDVAKAVYSGFGSLVGLNSLQSLVQAENGRALPGTGHAQHFDDADYQLAPNSWSWLRSRTTARRPPIIGVRAPVAKYRIWPVTVRYLLEIGVK